MYGQIRRAYSAEEGYDSKQIPVINAQVSTHSCLLMSTSYDAHGKIDSVRYREAQAVSVTHAGHVVVSVAE